jgi:hypothetical protein
MTRPVVTAAAARPALDADAFSVFARSLYPVGVVLALFALSDIATRVFPSNFGNLQWRFGVLGMSLSALSILLAGLALLGFTAAVRQSRGILWLIAAACALLSVTLVAALAMFSLDTLQLRGMLANPLMRTRISRMALSAAASGGIHFIGFMGLSVAAFMAARRSATVRRVKASPTAPSIVYRAD